VVRGAQGGRQHIADSLLILLHQDRAETLYGETMTRRTIGRAVRRMRDCDSLQLFQGGLEMGKTGRKRRARKKKGANHGKRPNA
jgi:hypothetical protein